MLSFIETARFTKLITEYLSDAEYLQLQRALDENPESGDIIPGSGGVRKLRWGRPGKGKRGGLRVIYYLRTQQGVIWMLTVYAKSETENIPAKILKEIAKEIENA